MFDEKRGNPEMHRAKKKDVRSKKRQPQKCIGLRKKTSNEKEATSKTQGAKKKYL
jgi:hypothetical protein